MNIATVLREEKLLQKQKKEKEEDLNNIEVMLNKNDFEEWRNKLKEKGIVNSEFLDNFFLIIYYFLNTNYL